MSGSLGAATATISGATLAIDLSLYDLRTAGDPADTIACLGILPKDMTGRPKEDQRARGRCTRAAPVPAAGESAMPEQPRSEARLPLLGAVLPKMIRTGELVVIDSRGRSSRFGKAHAEHSVTIRLRRRALPLRLALDPMLATGEAYMDGTLTIEKGTVRDFLLMATTGLDALHSAGPTRMLGKLHRLRDHLTPSNRRLRSRRNVEHHYDLPSELYDRFLDPDRLYSCAYFRTGSETLEQAQQAKLNHILAKLLIEPRQRVLDIGCGWGALATTIVEKTSASAKGLTLSSEQLSAARERAHRRGVADRAAFELLDYRDEHERFDRIVSVGMLEHVGRQHLDVFLAKVAALLKEDGVALIHSIGSTVGARAPNAAPDRWMDRYIFPGGYIPALSEVVTAAERAGLWVTDIEILRLHYAETLRCWWERFQAHRAEVHEMMGERFCRMWEFYLASAESGFRNGRLMVFQLQLAHSREAVPLTRDYVAEAEKRFEAPQEQQRANAA